MVHVSLSAKAKALQATSPVQPNPTVKESSLAHFDLITRSFTNLVKTAQARSLHKVTLANPLELDYDETLIGLIDAFERKMSKENNPSPELTKSKIVNSFSVWKNNIKNSPRITFITSSKSEVEDISFLPSNSSLYEIAVNKKDKSILLKRRKFSVG